MLDLRNITVAPLPAIAGLSSLSCAPRYAVVDHSTTPERPAVFVTERYTNSAFGAWFTSLGFSAPHPYVEASIKNTNDATELAVVEEGRTLFSGKVRRSSATYSSLFDIRSFSAFIAQGISSYGLSIHGDRLTCVDLHKNDGVYEPLDVLDVSGELIDGWLSEGAVLDSAFRTSNGQYAWSYRGLTS
jgi:hypothetical protein